MVGDELIDGRPVPHQGFKRDHAPAEGEVGGDRQDHDEEERQQPAEQVARAIDAWGGRGHLRPVYTSVAPQRARITGL